MLIYRMPTLQAWADAFRTALARRVFRHLWLKSPWPKLWVLPADAIGRDILTRGLFEKTELLALAHLLGHKHGGAKNHTFLDVGANIGNHAVFLAPLFKQVLAFEPNPLAFAILQANILQNRRGNIRAIPKGLGRQTAQLPFYANMTGNLGASGFVRGRGSRQIGSFRLASGDAELARLGVKPTQVQVVKLDVEGLETDTIAGLAKTLKAAHPLVLFEVLNRAQGEKTIAALRRLGYRHFAELAATQGFFRAEARLLPLVQPENRYYALVIAGVDEIASSAKGASQ